MGLQYKIKIVEYPNFKFVLDCDTLLFNTSLESIVLKVILCHIFTNNIDKLINKGDNYPLTYTILKSIPLFQPFLKIMRCKIIAEL